MKAQVTINELRVGNFVYGLNEYQGTAHRLVSIIVYLGLEAINLFWLLLFFV